MTHAFIALRMDATFTRNNSKSAYLRKVYKKRFIKSMHDWYLNLFGCRKLLDFIQLAKTQWQNVGIFISIRTLHHSILWNSYSILIFSHPPPWPTSARNQKHTCSTNHSQTICRNYPHIDFAFVDFVMTPVSLATLKILIWFHFTEGPTHNNEQTSVLWYRAL